MYRYRESSPLVDKGLSKALCCQHVWRVLRIVFYTCLVLVTQTAANAQVLAEGQGAWSPKLKLAVAANFAAPLRAIAKDYYDKTGQSASITVSSSGTLFAQISHGAQFDVFLSADVARIKALIKAGRIAEEDSRVYARGRLALLSRDAADFSDRQANRNLLPGITPSSLKGKKFAIANPKLAPYGEAAKQYLENIARWTMVKPHLVMGKNVLQTYQFFNTKNADFALVAYSLVVNAGDKPSVSSLLVPHNEHAPILQGLAITAEPKRKADARAFVEYLLSNDVQARLSDWGYEQVNPQTVARRTAYNMAKETQ